MLILFGRRRTPRSGGSTIRANSMGLWLVGGILATVGAAVSVESSGAPAAAQVQAGPVDDTLDYLNCLVRLLQGLDCDDEGTNPQPVQPTPVPDPTPVDPQE